MFWANRFIQAIILEDNKIDLRLQRVMLNEIYNMSEGGLGEPEILNAEKFRVLYIS